MKDQDVSLSMLSVTQAVAVFTALTPSISEVRKSVNDPVLSNDVRMAETLAATIVVGIGITATMLTKSAVPATVSIAAAAMFVFMYESVLRSTPKEIVK
jgi:hypothetical protein